MPLDSTENTAKCLVAITVHCVIDSGVFVVFVLVECLDVTAPSSALRNASAHVPSQMASVFYVRKVKWVNIVLKTAAVTVTITCVLLTVPVVTVVPVAGKDITVSCRKMSRRSPLECSG